MIPYGRQLIDRQDILAVVRVLKSDRITQGPKIAEFEEKFAAYCGARFAVAVSSGTAALHLATLALKLKGREEVVTSPISFVATSNAVLYAGGRPMFADVEQDTANLSVSEAARRIGARTRAIYPVHFAGMPSDMQGIADLSRRNNLAVVEDASHALGAEYRFRSRWERVGACRHSDMAVFSFHPVKHITTGEGGIITTNRPAFYERLKRLRTHGIMKTQSMMRHWGPWQYRMYDLGYNYRMTDLQAALGISQLRKIERFVRCRSEIAAQFDRSFTNLEGIEIPPQKEGFRNAYHLYVLRIQFKRLKKSRVQFMKSLQREGVGSQVHYLPIYRQPFYRRMGYRDRCPQAERFYESALSVPIFPAMTGGDVRKVISAVRKTLRS